MSGESATAKAAAAVVKGTKEAINCFASVSIKKREGFPRLDKQVDDRTIVLGPSDGPAWVSAVRTWFAGRGAPGIFEFYKAVSPLLPDASMQAPLDPDRPTVDLTKNVPGIKKLLKRVAATELGIHLCFPKDAKIDAMVESKTMLHLSHVRNFDGLVAISIKECATVDGNFTTCMPEILNDREIVAKGVQLWGGFYILAVENKLNTTPQGTSMQLKDALIADIRARAEDSGFNLWNLSTFLDKVTTRVTTITQKQPELSQAVAMEVNQTVINLTRSACQRVTLDPDASPALLGAATMLAHELKGLQARMSTTLWYDFRTAPNAAIANQLPPEPSDNNNGGYKAELQAIKLLSKGWLQRRTASVAMVAHSRKG
jgi:hypothetical protein